MSTCGIIAEYNPFHNGHLYQLNEAKARTKAENIVVVMSGNFVQRGAPALCGKYARTKSALANGADIVIELPNYFACASAEYFSAAAINILHNTGVVDYVAFGCETDDIEKLSSAAKKILHLDGRPAFKSAIKAELQKGVSFPAARQNALKGLEPSGGDCFSVLSQPNDILAVEYLKALNSIKSHISPVAIKRAIAPHHSKDLMPQISSATAIRDYIFNEAGNAKNGAYEKLKHIMPLTSYNILCNEITMGNAPNHLDNFSGILHYNLRMLEKSHLSQISDINEGIENRIIDFSQQYYKISDIIAHVKTKRYTYTRLQRAVLHILLNIRLSQLEHFMKKGGPQYIRILGFRKSKAHILTEITKKATLPIVLNLKHAGKILDEDALNMLNHEIKTTDIYNLGLRNQKKIGYEYTVPICIH